MALFRCTFKSSTIGRHVEFNVVIPQGAGRDIPWILLLHGKKGNQDDWLRFTSLERYCDKHGFAAVMPAVGNSFYADEVYGYAYYSFITGELIDYVRSVFPLSRKRSKTFVAGLSMGGYGAMKVGLRNPRRFSAIAAFSGVVDILWRFTQPGAGDTGIPVRSWGGDWRNVLAPRHGNREDVFSLIDDFRAKDKPWVFCGCGTLDNHYGFYASNIRMRDALVAKGFHTKWEEEEEGHSWVLWDKWIDEAMDFFREKMEAEVD